MPNSLCILPWMSLEATPTGNFRPCCLAEDLIVDKDGTAYDIANSGTFEVGISKFMIFSSNVFKDFKF